MSPKSTDGAGDRAAQATTPIDIDLGYEQARAQLREIVTRLESGEPSLEESLALWERGEALADVCQRWLDGASARLDEAIARHDAGADGERGGA